MRIISVEASAVFSKFQIASNLFEWRSLDTALAARASLVSMREQSMALAVGRPT